MASMKHKVSWPSGSMEEILGELEENPSSPCQAPFSHKLNNNAKNSPKRCLKTNGLSSSQSSFAPQLSKKHKVSWPSGSMEQILGELEENASSPCQVPLSPKLDNNSSVGRRKELSSYLGILARNAHLAPMTYTNWKTLKPNWDDMGQIVTTTKNPNGRDPSRVEMYILTHKPKNEAHLLRGTRKQVQVHPKANLLLRLMLSLWLRDMEV
ncbi:hypothetical protein JHK82_035661 [Glycine max]|nr:hypothetical protein JHK85_036386 [Glycine max]KAG4976320.1 hypothetical protein JHK86_035794 [Glycine max]KAG5112392.1 hypothetical protein JHK82_035661 [Glycine max]